MRSTPVVLCTFLALICMGRGHHPMEHAERARRSVDDYLYSLVASANKEFAFSLYRKLAAPGGPEGKNTFFSPLSVSVALAALSVGARGQTHKQIFNGLGFKSPLLSKSLVNHAFRTFIRSIASQKISQGTAVFVDDLFKPKPDFQNVLKQYYFTESFKVDFANPLESANTINQYISGKTNGKITNLVKDLDPSTVLYLLSYIYFKGSWATAFDPKLTSPDVFRVDNNTEVPVQMMSLQHAVDTYYDEALKTSVLQLPFTNSFSMLLLLPDQMDTLEREISPAHVSRWFKQMEKGHYEIFVPKFSIKTSYKLNDVLTEMGMVDMFGFSADLSGIAEGPLALSEVLHQATLDVDEAGATATAVTGGGVVLKAVPVVPELKFNRPFMMIITDRSAENFLFVGKIVNPNI